MSIVRIAVTGGPCGGKTTIMEQVQKMYGQQVLVMPEVASILLDNGFPKPGKDVDFGDRWLDSFQNSVLPVQLNMENEYEHKALRNITRVVLCDRGLLDGAAYLGKGVDFFLEKFNLDKQEVHARYDVVIHLESLAVSSPELYEMYKTTNPARYESATEAAEVDAAIKAVWSDHPSHKVIGGGQGLKYSLAEVVSVLNGFLCSEVERKYVMAKMPAVDLGLPHFIRQGYLSTDVSSELRIRQIDDQYYLTIKGDGTHTRKECERSIDEWAFESLWPRTKGFRIEKNRYLISHADHTLEIDQYLGGLEGLIVLECEFQSIEDFNSFQLPSWTEKAVDVTEDDRFKNKNLAINGYIPWL